MHVLPQPGIMFSFTKSFIIPASYSTVHLPCSDHLKIHKKTHDTQKPYQCSVCNRGYNTAAALTAHMQNHKAKLTAHALNQLLKDAQAPVETHTLTQLLRDSAAAEAHSHSFNHFLKDGQKVSKRLTGSIAMFVWLASVGAVGGFLPFLKYRYKVK